MRKIKTVLLDDDSNANELMNGILKSIPRIEVVAMFTDPVKALNYLYKKPAHLLILDKEMPGVDGLEVAQQLPSEMVCVMVTGYDSFALEAYEYNIVDYLLKNLTFSRVNQMVRKVESALGLSNSLPAEALSSRYFTVKRSNEKRLIPYDELFYIESAKDESELYFIDGTHLTITERIGVFQDDLPVSDFKRVHNKYILNKTYARTLKDKMITISCAGNSKVINVGNTYEKSVNEWFNDKLIKG
ncbi:MULTISPECIES: LytR/AlgR family response regulator transcription factor [Sphingobacterium]|uniref:LytR/AlgR family response regulator transcription factor n=1 Tax=Sphingobacterium TaxID=28453 RepID=UPI0013DC57EE|nr:MULTISPECIES: LytTR family DNA-binding domain-containing protein [unclassified Sphingobacterium]